MKPPLSSDASVAWSPSSLLSLFQSIVGMISHGDVKEVHSHQKEEGYVLVGDWKLAANKTTRVLGS